MGMHIHSLLLQVDSFGFYIICSTYVSSELLQVKLLLHVYYLTGIMPSDGDIIVNMLVQAIPYRDHLYFCSLSHVANHDSIPHIFHIFMV